MLIVAVVVGALVGESIGFWLGRWLGPADPPLAARAAHRRARTGTRSERYLRRRGGPGDLPLALPAGAALARAAHRGHERLLVPPVPRLDRSRVHHLGRRCTSRSRRSRPAPIASSPTSCTSRATSSSAIIVVFLLLVYVSKKVIERAERKHLARRRGAAGATPTIGSHAGGRGRLRAMPADASTPARRKVLWLARLEYRFHAWRERRARARGLTPDRDAVPRLRRRRLGAGRSAAC